jgi:hypothetical protein
MLNRCAEYVDPVGISVIFLIAILPAMAIRAFSTMASIRRDNWMPALSKFNFLDRFSYIHQANNLLKVAVTS